MLQQIEQFLARTPADRLERLDSPAVADAQRGMRVLHPRIQSIVPGCTIAGPAYTVRAYPGSLMTVMKALMEAPPGAVLVVEADGDLTAGALWGELVSEEARQRGLKGIVIDGPVRDRKGLRAVGFPTFAAGVTPRVGNNVQIGLVQVPISCGNVAIQPGDWVFADDDGVVAIPADELEKVLERAEAIEQKDREMAVRVADGERLADILGFDRYIYAEQANITVLSKPGT